MTGLSGETDDPEPAIGSEKVEECGIESTAIKDNLSHESRKNDKDEEILRKVAGPIPGSVLARYATHYGRAFLILWNDSPLHGFYAKQPRRPAASRHARLGSVKSFSGV